MYMKTNTEEKIEESFIEVLSELPLSKLRSLFAFVNYIKRESAAASVDFLPNPFDTVLVSSFVREGLSRSQIDEIVEILRVLHEKKYGSQDISIGVANMYFPPKETTSKEGNRVIKGLVGVPVDWLMQYLPKKIEIMEGTIGKMSTRNNTSFEEIKERVPEPAPQTTSEKNGIGYLDWDKGKTEIGPAKNGPFKLLEALCPFGAPKGIGAIYKASLTGRSKHKEGDPLSPDEKQGILRHRIKELQKILKKKKIKVSLVFDTRAETVFLKLN